MATPEGQDAPVQTLIGGRYLDQLVREAEGWKIKHRSYLMEWNVNWAVALSGLRAFDHDRDLHGAQRSADAGLQFLSAWLSAQETIKGGTVEHTVELLNEVDKALAGHAIHELLMAQARGTDRRDLDPLTSPWHDDALLMLYLPWSSEGLSASPDISAV